MTDKRKAQILDELLGWALEVAADVNDVVYACGVSKKEAKELGILED